ncbi:hypothetical protein [Rhizobium leguminosarum]|nr:hypothetical protein [Rhizobium leguminosarum]TAU83265.1 hypothetical protein ELI40_08230 [Rhizobium leguminosarum]
MARLGTRDGLRSEPGRVLQSSAAGFVYSLLSFDVANEKLGAAGLGGELEIEPTVDHKPRGPAIIRIPTSA